MPALQLDGKEGPQTQRALCAIRWLSCQPASREKASPMELKGLMARRQLVAPYSGLIVNRTCQVMAVDIDDKLSMVLPVSTGKRGFITPEMHSRIYYALAGWHNSSLYPDEDGPGNMYNSVFSKGDFAIHGSLGMRDSVTYPASHGCVRVSLEDARTIWKIAGGPANLPNDTEYKGFKPLPVHVI